MSIKEKSRKLKKIISQYKSAVIAFSGGVDSTFLAKTALEVLDNKILLVTIYSPAYPLFELNETKKLAKHLAIEHRIIVFEKIIDIPEFSDNVPDRCYYCKKKLFTLIKHIADEEHYDIVFDGTNADDRHDYRPGIRALRELGIVSPLCDADLTKKEIRILSGQLGLACSQKHASSCLASRFPYREKITKAKLDRVALAEQEIRKLGFTQFRVRSHENLARIEYAKEEMDMAWRIKEQIQDICKKAGYVYTAIDLLGYRTGAMNEALSYYS